MLPTIHFFKTMTQEQLTAFINYAKGDTTLQEKLKAASDVDAVVAIAQDAGFMTSGDEPTKAQVEVSDEELEGAAGGLGRIGFLTILSCFWH